MFSGCEICFDEREYLNPFNDRIFVCFESSRLLLRQLWLVQWWFDHHYLGLPCHFWKVPLWFGIIHYRRIPARMCGVSSHSQDAVQIHVSENIPDTQNLFRKELRDVKIHAKCSEKDREAITHSTKWITYAWWILHCHVSFPDGVQDS